MAKKLSDDAAPKKPNLSPDTFLEYYREIRRERVKLEEQSGAYRMVRKRAKNAGVDMAAMALMEALARLDSEDAALRLKQLGYYGQLAGLPWATQMDLFGNYDAPKPTEKSLETQAHFDAEEDGRFAGAGGDSDTLNPNPAGSPLHAAWSTGWHNGKAFFDRRKEAEGSEVKRPRGRPRKNANPEDRAAA